MFPHRPLLSLKKRLTLKAFRIPSIAFQTDSNMKGLFNFLIVGIMAALAIAADTDGEQMVSARNWSHALS